MVNEDRRKDTATAKAISDALKLEAEHAHEIAPRRLPDDPVAAELADHLLFVGIDRRNPENNDKTEADE